MPLRLINFSIVVTAEHHNPTILNPDFLARQDIVPDDWGWELGDRVLSTPLLAQVSYTNAVSLLCDQAKLQILDARPSVNPAESKITQIALSYVRVLHHVRYTAVGINFNGAIERDSPQAALIDRFLAQGFWNNEQNRLQDVALHLFYPVEDGRLRVGLESGEIREPSESGQESVRSAIVVGANFHHGLSADNTVDKIGAIVERSPAYWRQLAELITPMLEVS